MMADFQGVGFERRITIPETGHEFVNLNKEEENHGNVLLSVSGGGGK